MKEARNDIRRQHRDKGKHTKNWSKDRSQNHHHHHNHNNNNNHHLFKMADVHSRYLHRTGSVDFLAEPYNVRERYKEYTFLATPGALWEGLSGQFSSGKKWLAPPPWFRGHNPIFQCASRGAPEPPFNYVIATVQSNGYELQRQSYITHCLRTSYIGNSVT